MLRNELQELEELLFAQDCSYKKAIAESCVESTCKNVRQAWLKATFSGIPEHSLIRYLHFHQKGISKISDTLYSFHGTDHFEYLQLELLSLIDHLKYQHSPYFNQDYFAPFAFQQRLMGRLEGSIKLISERVHVSRLSAGLKSCLMNWLSDAAQTNRDVQYTFRYLSYLENLIGQLISVDMNADRAENTLITLLSRSNFNHLAFLVYRQEVILNDMNKFVITEERLNFLKEQKAAVMSCPEKKEVAYDLNWPSLKTMMGDWLQEQIYLAVAAMQKEKLIQPECSVKLPVKLSVAHLACLIRLLFEENVFGTENLKLIFKFFALNYQTKRQAIISPGSLSKEFYSIDQHTAARVKDLLQKMVLRINRDFFPVMAAIGITALVYPGMH